MSAGTSWLHRIGATFADTRSAWKAVPKPGALYPPPQSQTYYPINFPGWAEWEKLGQTQSKDESRVKTAIQSPWVFSDVQAIANEFSTSELIIKERKGLKLEDVENHPLEVIWESPNAHMGRSYLMQFWAWSYALSGKAYLFWAPQAGRPAECWPIPPFMITPVPSDDEFISGYVFKSGPQAKPTLIPREYITFSRSVNLFDVRDGMSFLVAAMIGIETDLAAESWNRNFFAESNGVPDGLITVNPEMLDPELARVRLELREFFGGTRRGVAVARSGDMDYKAFGRTQKEIEFKEGIDLVSRVIGRTLGFPDGYWSETANRANAEQARATMIAGAVWPKLVTLAEDLNAQTVPRWFGKQYRAEFKDIRPEDRELKLKELQARAAYHTIDELREMDGRDPLGDNRGRLLVAEIGKGMTDGASPEEQATEAEAEEETVDPATMPPAELPEGEEPAPVEDDTGSEPNPADTMKADLARWQRKALGAIRSGRSAAVRFESQAIPPDAAAAISARLAGATDAAAVKAAFSVKARGDGDLTPDEAALTDALTDALRTHQQAIASAAERGQAASLTALGAALGEVLTPALVARFLTSDLDLPPNAAQGWVAEYLPGAIRGLNETTAEVVRRAIDAARQGASQAQTAATLASAFSPARAEMIAITELTRAAAQATTASQRYLAERGVPSTQIWRTGNDERTCAICGPRNGARQGEGWDEPPPAHPRCRCFTTLDVLR